MEELKIMSIEEWISYNNYDKKLKSIFLSIIIIILFISNVLMLFIAITYLIEYKFKEGITCLFISIITIILIILIDKILYKKIPIDDNLIINYISDYIEYKKKIIEKNNFIKNLNHNKTLKYRK